MFLIFKCTGKSDLSLCMSLVLSKKMPLHSADFQRILQPNMFKNQKSVLRSCILFTNTELPHRPRSDSPLHVDRGNFSQICTGKLIANAQRLLATAVPERWPQVCCVKITCKLLLMISFVSTTTNSMKCLVNWIPLHANVRFEQTQPCQTSL